eukprot:TRINITY_DN3846_c0_g1_i1.p1 TRINITY_DN3846_c0_g1~~TRINITY_DN3846_c0_g1_i1.p1  ORF type:complete len:249 (-),score=20.20 TRINITY_DN3846_c0_g1_i1:474-1220(-)
MIMINNTITHLNISGHRFGQEVMQAIRMNSTIQNLNISGCSCNDQMFENTRGTSPNLTHLDISENDFQFTHITDWLKYNVNLKSLTLSGYQLKGNGKDAFCKWLPKQSALTELTIIDVRNNVNGIGQSLKAHGKLQKITLNSIPSRVVEEEEILSLIESLSFNKDLDYLDLTSSLQRQEYSAPISRLINSLPLLTELNLKNNWLDQNICEPLRQNSTLTTLDLNGCFQNEDDLVKVCERFTIIRHSHC